jgi:hypothetical protein
VDERDVQTVMKTLLRIEENTKRILELLGEDDDEEEEADS